MSSMRTRTATVSALALLLSGSAVFGADDRRQGSEASSAQEPLFFSTIAGESAQDVRFPEGYVSDNAIMVYQHQFGLYPYIHSETGEVINGGVPQRTNIAAHLRELAKDIDRQIPVDFDGYVVIDYEEWHPFWEDTAGRYQVMSRSIIRAQNPRWSDAKIERKARVSFEAAAKKVLKRTLDQCRSMRPNAKWGIWSYPKAKFRDNNARWLWDRHDAFFPAVYMQYSLVPDDVEPGLGEANVSQFVEDRLIGRIVYARELAGERPVLSVLWPRYTKRNPSEWLRYKPLKQSDLALAMEGSLDYGADGVVIWDNVPQPGVAEIFQEQIDNSIAPEMRRILADRGIEIDNPLSNTDGSTDDAVAGADQESDNDADMAPGSDDRLSATPRASSRGVKKTTSRRRGG